MRTAIAFLHFAAVSCLCSVVLGFAAGGLAPWSAGISLALGAGVALWGARTGGEGWGKIDPFGGLALLAFALFALRSFLWLAFETGDELRVFSRNNYGDFPLHLTYINLLANGASFWPENPIFAGKPLTYPLGTDLLHALFVACGANTLRMFPWLGLAFGLSAAAMLWRWGRGFAVAGFLFAGGVLGFLVFTRGELVDYQADDAYENFVVAWKSLPLALFVTQRGLLYALPAGLALLASWRARLVEPTRDRQVLPFWSELLLYAAMPLFHLHTFLFLSVVAGWWFLAWEPARRHLAWLVGCAFLPATALVYCVLGGLGGGGGVSLVSLKRGWMQEDQNFFAFWFTNFGVLPLLVAWLVVLIFRRRTSDSATLIVLPSLTVFLVCCMVKFAPWEWDNTKLMLWSYVAILPPLWECIVERQRVWLRAAMCVALFFSGAVSLAGGLLGEPADTMGYAVARRSEIEGAAFGARDIPIGDRFVAHPTFNHPLLIGGRLLAMGYEGHLWSHGIDFRKRKAVVEHILNGGDGWREYAAALGVRWLYWGSEEEAEYTKSKRPWEIECRLHASGRWGAIYDLTQPPGPPAR